MRITHYQRKPSHTFSVERLFSDVRNALPIECKARVQLSRFESIGIWRRFYNVIEAAFHQGDINHVTGDVHFLTYLLTRRKTVLTVLDCVTLERLKGIKRQLLWFFWYWLPIRRSAVVTVISDSTKNELLKYVNCAQDKIRVIHCPVSPSFTVKQKVFNTDCPRILQIGTKQNKNIERLAQALKGLSSHLVIIGKLSKLQHSALAINCISYENHIGLSDAELLDLYQSTDMLAFVSTYEGFGLPIVEANAVGRPVITSNIYSMPEVADEAACIVDPYDVAAIRSGIDRIISDTEYRNKLVEAGFKNIERFSAEYIAVQYAELYRSLYRNNCKPNRVN